MVLLFTAFFRVNAVEVIVHDKNIATSALTTYQIRQIYTMRQTVWQDGQKIVVYALASNSELHQEFSKEILKIFPYQLDRIWRKLIYSGLGEMPVIVNSISELKTAVMNTPGAIGYIDKVGQGDNFNVIKITE